MAISRSRRRPAGIDYWPGFVDALSTLLAHRHLPDGAVHGRAVFRGAGGQRKRHALALLQKQIAQLAYSLSLEQSQKNSALDDASSLRATLAATEAEKKRWRGFWAPGGDSAEVRVSAITKQLDEQRGITAQALAQIELLTSKLSRCANSSPRLRTRSATPISAISRRRRRSPTSASG